ncbi:hypothetical protein BGZ63DRAFT_377952 [Mariannaea sp. PMI_226]|nr:hypothetical protein BGZ63DRAFT_377952 [Mariannaea sp. PMI_226]
MDWKVRDEARDEAEDEQQQEKETYVWSLKRADLRYPARFASSFIWHATHGLIFFTPLAFSRPPITIIIIINGDRSVPYTYSIIFTVIDKATTLVTSTSPSITIHHHTGGRDHQENANTNIIIELEFFLRVAVWSMLGQFSTIAPKMYIRRKSALHRKWPFRGESLEAFSFF